MTIPKFRLEYDEAFIARYRGEVGRILRSDALSEGPWVRQFEQGFAKFIGARHAVATCNGTTALEVALRAVGVAGKEVIVPTNTFIATAIAVERAGGILRLVDIEPDTFAVDPERLEKAITKSTGAVVLVHIGGTVSKYVGPIVEICNRYGVPLVEDAAHAHGASRGVFRAGTIGQAAAFSFFPTKVMTTGEGGMVTTNEEKIRFRSSCFKDFGRISPAWSTISGHGLNAHMTEFQGLLGCMELERVTYRTLQRRTLSDSYCIELKGSNQLSAHLDTVDGSYYKQIVRTKVNASLFHDFCHERGVELAGTVYECPLHMQPVYAGRWKEADFPVANEFCAHHVCPPLYPEMSMEDVRYVCDVLKAAEKELA